MTLSFHCDLLMLTLLLSLGVGNLCCVAAKRSEEHSAYIYKVYIDGVIKIQYTLRF